MRVLVVGSGAEYSTKDVENGYIRALQKVGHEVVYYDLAMRLKVAPRVNRYLWNCYGKPPEHKPDLEDEVYWSCSGIPERALMHRADWILAVSGTFLHPFWAAALRKWGYRLALLYTESPYDDKPQTNLAAVANVVFTNERASVEALKRYNRNVHYLAHAYDPEKHRPDQVTDAPVHDVVFVGTLFEERIATLEAVDWNGIDLGLYGQQHILRRNSPLRSHVRDGIIPNEQAAALYRRAKIGLNLYRTSIHYERHAEHVTGAESLNPRALELAACGAFTISDYRDEVAETFGRAVPTFSRPQELGQLIRYYLAHENERQDLAARLPGCVTGRTYAARTQELVKVLEDYNG